VNVKGQKIFYVSKGGAYSGPYKIEDIIKKIQSLEHSWMDYVYDENLQDWVLLMEHPLFTEKFNSTLENKMPLPAEVNPSESAHKEKAWYILKEGNNYGPFSQLEIVQMLQEKALYEYDFIWHQKLPSWKRVAEVKEFENAEIRKLKDSLPTDLSEVFFRRRYLRAQYGCSLIVHNNKSVFRGQSLEISAGGAGILIDSADLQPGQTLFLHFQPGDGVPPFNAVCSIISKTFVKESEKDKGLMKYGVKFTSISTTVREKIKGFAESTKKAA